MTITIIFDYIFWLYSGGIREYFKAWANFHWFLFHFFSTDILARTLFSPWHRLQERKPGRGLDIEGFFERAFINFILRMVGFFVRSAFILVSMIGQTFLFIGGVLVFVLFIFSPVILPVLFISGIFITLVYQ